MKMGIGYVLNVKSRTKENGFAWQIITGLEYEIVHSLNASIEYRFNKGRSQIYNHGAVLTAKCHF